ncbi:RNA-splicing factor [Saitoella coloradoensis]
MSYNNIGLSTPRGSGTNGYIVRNLSHIRRKDSTPYKRPEEIDKEAEQQRDRKGDKEILEHERKREVEVKCFELRDRLEEEGVLGEDEIEEKVGELRKELLEKMKSGNSTKDAKTLKPHQVHDIAEAKQQELEKFRKAIYESKDVRPFRDRR